MLTSVLFLFSASPPVPPSPLPPPSILPVQLQTTLQSRPRNSATRTSVDAKFLLIPLAFLILRLGSIVVVIVYVYVQADVKVTITYVILCFAVSQ